MPRYTYLASALAAAMLMSSNAQAQRFSGVYTFGDSLSDAGNVGLATQPAGGPSQSYTTNPDPVFAEILAQYFGYTQTPSLLGGGNFAWGGACVQPATGPSTPPCVSTAVPRVPTQIQQHLAANGGVANPNALYTMWGGFNDIAAPLLGGLWTTQAQIQAGSTVVGSAFLGNVTTLRASGANYIVVLNAPDFGVTPQLVAAGPTAAGGASLAAVTFNGVVNAGLASMNEGIIPVNAFGLLNEARANPGLFGFTNVTSVACSVPSSLNCTGSTLIAPGANQTYLFADGVHPSGGAHRMIADAIVSTIEAPVLVSFAAEAPMLTSADHQRAIDQALFEDFGIDREAGTMRAFANVNFGTGDINASTFAPAAEADGSTVSFGVNYRSSERWSWGGAASFGNQDMETSLGVVDSRTVMLTAFAQANFDGLFVRAGLGGGSSSLDFDRRIQFVSSTRTESGTSDANYATGEVTVGYVFGDDSFMHGPFAGVLYQDISIAGFAEEGVTSTSMNYSDFDRESMITRVGYQLSASLGEGKYRPFARVTYNEDSEDDVVRVNAGLNSMNGRFTMDGFAPAKDWMEIDAGITLYATDRTQFNMSYRGRFSDDSQDRTSLNLGMRIDF